MARPSGALKTVLALVLCFLPGFAMAEQRIALIVGNGAYTSVATLDNTVNDAVLLAKLTEEAGFGVTLLTDADQATLNQAIAKFGRDLRAAGPETTGLFYYAGHGVQSFGSNFLLPTDAALTDAADLGLVGVPADTVLRQMASARNKTNIVILDACRNNPFVDIPDMNDNGLAEMNAPTGTFLAYSTAPGAVALDGLDSNSPYTAALAEEMSIKGVPIEQLFKQVRVKVLNQTFGKQTPWDTSSLTTQFMFHLAEVPSAEDVAARQLWTSVQATNDPVQIMLFLRAYPDSDFADEARLALASAMSAELGPTAADLGEDLGAALAAAPEAAPAAAPEPTAPPPDASTDNRELIDPREQELIEIAGRSGLAGDYEAYLAAFPSGIFAELAKFELTILANAAVAPSVEASVATVPTPATEAVATQDDAPAAPEIPSFDTPLTTGGEGVQGKSIAALIEGSPLFAPIEGIPDSLWKGQTCASCHNWTKDTLCDQSKTYLAESAQRSLEKLHPLGTHFKQSLVEWAKGGCR